MIQTLSVLLASLVVSAAAYAEPATHLINYGGTTRVTMTLDKSSVLAQRIADALIKSPLVKEASNPYVQPKTVYNGDKFQLNLAGSNNQMILFFEFGADETPDYLLNGANFQATNRFGSRAVTSFHAALLASTSEYVTSKKNPGSLNPAEGTAIVLEKTRLLGLVLYVAKLMAATMFRTVLLRLRDKA